MKKIRVFETFAGIGAQHKALKILKENNILDFEIAGTSEWDIFANLSYNSIHNKNKNINANADYTFLNSFTHSSDSKKPIKNKFNTKNNQFFLNKLENSLKQCNNQGDITNITGQSLLQNIGDFDLLTYSFPCQDLSSAGNFHGFNQGMKKGSNTRSGLLWEIERILEQLNKLNKLNKLPKFLLLENVKNMISPKHKQDYLQWISFLNKLGYNTQTYLLNAKNYGIPQSRERVYALSILNSKTFNDTFLKTNQIIEKNCPKDVSKMFNIYKKIDDVLKIDYSIEKYKNEALNATPNKTPSRKKMFNQNPILYTKDKKSIENKINDYQFINKSYYLNYSRTITTKQDRNPNAGIIDLKNTIIENQKDKANFRFITPREAYLLMGFDEKDYEKVIENKEIKKEVLYRQAGNSIVVNVLVAIFYFLKDKIGNE